MPSSEDNMPQDRGKTKASGTFKEPRETVLDCLDNLNKVRIILWGCIVASLKSTVKLSQLPRRYNFTLELLGGDVAPGY